MKLIICLTTILILANASIIPTTGGDDNNLNSTDTDTSNETLDITTKLNLEQNDETVSSVIPSQQIDETATPMTEIPITTETSALFQTTTPMAPAPTTTQKPVGTTETNFNLLDPKHKDLLDRLIADVFKPQPSASRLESFTLRKVKEYPETNDLVTADLNDAVLDDHHSEEKNKSLEKVDETTNTTLEVLKNITNLEKKELSLLSDIPNEIKMVIINVVTVLSLSALGILATLLPCSQRCISRKILFRYREGLASNVWELGPLKPTTV